VALLVGLVMAVGTVVWLAFVNSLETYLLHPALFAMQAAPYGVAATLWLPRKVGLEAGVAMRLAIGLGLASVVVYAGVVLGRGSMGGDMVALTFAGIDIVAMVAVLVATAGAHAFQIRHRRRARHPRLR